MTLEIVKIVKTLRHMLGVNSVTRPRSWGYRNYFAAGPGQIQHLERMVELGVAYRGHKTERLQYYHATSAGMDAIGLTAEQKKRATEE